MLSPRNPPTEMAPGILGQSALTVKMRQAIERCAPHTSTVLITGPTGTGKELVARSIHRQGTRAGERFIPVDCTTITGPLFASQLFGHRKGAFTGADYEAIGCFRAAHNGTIFLDEIGEIELDLQAKLLRVLQEHVVVPVGGHDGVSLDVRVLCATNRDLKREVVEGRFREDLYYRLNVVQIEAPALSDRTDDIPLLTDHFLDQLATRAGFPRKQLSPGALELLATFNWPGNVRQLRHFIEQAVIACDQDLITLPLVQQLLDQARMPVGATSKTEGRREDNGAQVANASSSASGLASYSPATVGTPTSWKTLHDLEREHIRTTLEHTFYNQSAAARLLGISRQALIRKMQAYYLTLPKAAK